MSAELDAYIKKYPPATANEGQKTGISGNSSALDDYINKYDNPPQGIGAVEEEDDGSFLGDVGTGLASGAGVLLKGGGDLYGLATGDVENWASSHGQRVQDYWNEGKSKELVKQEAEIEKAVEDNTGDEWSKFGTSLYETLSRPRVLANKLAEQGASLFAMGGAGALAGAGAKGLGAAAKTIGKARTAGAIGTGGLQQGADVGRSTYDEIQELGQDKWDKSPDYQALIAEGRTPEEAKHTMALERAQMAGAEGFATSLITNFGQQSN